LTYPASPLEAQHINFRKQPKINLWAVRPLKAGSRGPRVGIVVRLLWEIEDPQTGKPYLNPQVHPHGQMTPNVVAAVKAFQHDHHQREDGTVGIHTIRALRAALRLQRKRKKVHASGKV